MARSKKRVLVVFPTEWDKKQFRACRDLWSREYEIVYAEPADDDCAWDFDVLSFIDETVRTHRGRLDGVVSSSDYPGPIVAAAITSELGLPGPSPEAVLRASTKVEARKVGAAVVPWATPAFELVTASAPALERLRFPCFVKPVKGTFSILSGIVRSAEELRVFVTQPAAAEFHAYYIHMFTQLLARYADFETDGRAFVCEEVLCGVQATVEGFVRKGSAEIVGVVDSFLDQRTGSFTRFEYPSALSPNIVERLSEAASRLATGVGLNDCFFNVEMFYDAPADRIAVIEINPRICGQFADLYGYVDGVNTFGPLVALACGDAVTIGSRKGGPWGAAASFPLRVFTTTRVRRAPSASTIATVERDTPGVMIWSECAPGEELSVGEGIEDGRSRRYGVINVGAASSVELAARGEACRAALGYDLAPPPRPLEGGVA